MPNDSHHELIRRDFAFEGDLVRVSRDRIRFPNGHVATHDTIHLPDAVAVVALLEEAAGVRLVLVEQFRPALARHIHELPAGMLEKGEEAEACARRELEEETGYIAGECRHLVTLYQIPGTSAHRLHFFLARGLSKGRQRLDEAECLRVRECELEGLLDEIRDDRGGRRRIFDTKTHLGVLHASLLLGRQGGVAGAEGGEGRER